MTPLGMYMNAIRLTFSAAISEALAVDTNGRMMSKNGSAIVAAAPFRAARRDIIGTRVTRRCVRGDSRPELVSHFGFGIGFFSMTKEAVTLQMSVPLDSLVGRKFVGARSL